MPTRPTSLRFALATALLALAAGGCTSATAQQPAPAPAPATTAPAPAPATTAQAPAPANATLDSLVGPVALYPDPLLAQLLLASTFPDQVRQAAAHVRQHGVSDIDTQSWDVSVKAVAHYPQALNLLDSRPEWLERLGTAYATQSAAVMDAVQRLRQQAVARGNLATTREQQVVVQPSHIAIWPANPQVVYVPVYDPALVYYRSAWGPSPFVTFGLGWPVGPWFIYDWDWPARRIVYIGWVGGGWYGRARPYIVPTPVYVHERFRVAAVGPGRYAVPRGAVAGGWAAGGFVGRGGGWGGGWGGGMRMGGRGGRRR
jgi:hypothetical protein